MQLSQTNNNQYNVGNANPAASFPNYNPDFIGNLMQLQQSFADASSQQFDAAQLRSSHAMMQQYQDQRISDLSGERSENLAPYGNNVNNAQSGNELEDTFDNDVK
jgi:hypothetical protein